MSDDLANGLEAFFSQQHREADAHWAAVEAAVQAGECAGIQAATAAFVRSLRQHLDLEEKVLFPEFVVATGIQHGPTTVMTAEHRQMRALLDEIEAAAEGDDREALIGQGDSLLMLTQQHNMKEEAMLYPMCEDHLQERWSHILQRAREFV